VLNRTAQLVQKFTEGLVSDGRTPKDTVRTPSFPRDPAEKITVALLVEISNEARKVGAKLVLVLEDGMGRQGQGLESFFISRHIPVLNLDAVFPQEERERFHLPDDAHWNARGHSVLADCLLNYLEAVGLLSPRQESP